MTGYVALLALAYLLSEDRRRILWRTVLMGLALQLGLAEVLINLAAARGAVLVLNGAATALQDATDQGTAFLFGYLGGGPAPFGALPFHRGVLQRLTGAFAWLLRRTMGVGGAAASAS